MASTASRADIDSARRAIVKAARQLVDGAVLSRSQHGNISLRVGDDRFVLTGRSLLRQVDPDELPLLDLAGELVEGDIDPASREIIQMHGAIYRTRSDIGAVIHTHSPHVTAFALAGKPIEPVYEALVRFGYADGVPVARYGPRGSEQSVNNILHVVGPDTKAVLLENHGLLAFDTDIEKAVRSVFILEEAAELILLAGALGGAKPIPREMIDATQSRQRAFAGHDAATAKDQSH